MITFEHVTKVYPRARTYALDDVDFQIRRGEFVYVTGHSGAGKSTMLSLLLRRFTPSEGRVLVHGHDLATLPERRLPLLRRSIGMVFQDHRLLSQMTALENLTFALRATGIRGDLAKRATTVLRQVGLAYKKDAFPMELSLGEQQRIAIARAMVTNPPLLLCDEPTGNLDPDTSWEILELLDTLNVRGTTIVVATHSRELVNALRRRTLVLRGGKLVIDAREGGYEL